MKEAIDTYGDWLRVLQIFMSLLVILMASVRIVRVWKDYHWTQRMIFFALVLYNIGIAGRSLEVIFQDQQPYSFFINFIFAADVLMIIYLWEPREAWHQRLGQDLRYPPPRDPRKPDDPLNPER